MLEREEHLQAVGEQGVAKPLVEEDAKTVPKDRGLRCLRSTCSGQRWRLSQYESSVVDQWRSEEEEHFVRAVRMFMLWKT